MVECEGGESCGSSVEFGRIRRGRVGGVSGAVEVLELSHNLFDCGGIAGDGGDDASALFVRADDGQVVGKHENVTVGCQAVFCLLEDG